MSKKQKSQTLQGLESLKVLISVDPEPEVVESIANALMELPQYIALESAKALQDEAAVLRTEEAKILGDESFDDIKARISGLQAKAAQLRSNTKSLVLAHPGISEVRALMGKFNEWLDKQVDHELSRSAKYLGIQAEQDVAMKAALRAKELRESYEAKEAEAQKLLASISL